MHNPSVYASSGCYQVATSGSSEQKRFDAKLQWLAAFPQVKHIFGILSTNGNFFASVPQVEKVFEMELKYFYIYGNVFLIVDWDLVYDRIPLN